MELIGANIPVYQFCGPGTRLNRLARNEGINRLGVTCKCNDMQIKKNDNADKILEKSR